jgi:hypothetical protein
MTMNDTPERMSPAAVFTFWGGPWNGRTVALQGAPPFYVVNEYDHAGRTSKGFSAMLDYLGGDSAADFHVGFVEYVLFCGEYVDAKLLSHLRPGSINDVLRHLAMRP